MLPKLLDLQTAFKYHASSTRVGQGNCILCQANGFAYFLTKSTYRIYALKCVSERKMISGFMHTFITSSLSLSQRTKTLELLDSGKEVARDDTSCARRLALTIPPLPPMVAAERNDDEK